VLRILRIDCGRPAALRYKRGMALFPPNKTNPIQMTKSEARNEFKARNSNDRRFRTVVLDFTLSDLLPGARGFKPAKTASYSCLSPHSTDSFFGVR
jgi:hypothetical protein